MPKFIIKEISSVVTTYEVEAESANEAEEKLYDFGEDVKEIGTDSQRFDVYIDSITLKEGGNILCVECKKGFSGIEGKEDTCPSCLEKLMKRI